MTAEAPRRARKQRFAAGLLTQEPESEAMPEVFGAVAVPGTPFAFLGFIV